MDTLSTYLHGAGKTLVRRVLHRFGYSLYRTSTVDLQRSHQCPWVPPGHFFSPHPDLEDIRRYEARIFSREKTVLDIDFREQDQLRILHAMAALHPRIEFPESKSSSFRYYFINPAYSYSDALVLH